MCRGGLWELAIKRGCLISLQARSHVFLSLGEEKTSMNALYWGRKIWHVVFRLA